MGYRSFRDARGVEWQTWDIIPRLAERRQADRRTAPVGRVAAERRASSERRLRNAGRVALSGGLHAGWLCFEAPDEKRRLTPIPADWLRCAVAKLEEYLRLAVPATRVRASPDLSRLTERRERRT